MELKSSGRVTSLTIIITLAVLIRLNGVSAGPMDVTGQTQKCNNEGQSVSIESVVTSNCFVCFCNNGEVQCQHGQRCPNTVGCHLLIENYDDCCPQTCQGCMYHGTPHESDTEWIDPEKPCNTFRCEAGVVTKSDLQCYVPCDNPIPPAPGKCCPTCPDCRINGQMTRDDRDVTSDDPCVKCRCIQGEMACEKKACPVLQCTGERQQHLEGECCPRCIGTKSHFQPRDLCLFRDGVYRESNTTTAVDECTRCQCINQTTVCQRRSCPILDCPVEEQIRKPNTCCRACVPILQAKSECRFGGKAYQDGESWELDACSSCRCHNGKPSCAKTHCPPLKPCPYGSHLIKKPGECCAICESNEGTCMAFGDPHYKTFDGKMYTFQGSGKYQLASDCVGHTFSIRVTNGNRSRSSTSTKRVRVKYEDTRINLGQGKRIRLNGTKVNTPYNSTAVSIVFTTDRNLLLRFSNNLKILWNGISFLEVTVPGMYKNKVCGLCGNFNSNPLDDFRTRKGPDADSAQKFGNSWCVGPDCARQRRRVLQIQTCDTSNSKRRNPCRNVQLLFGDCKDKMQNYLNYYKACLEDMCNCPSGDCHCDSLFALAQECSRLGINVRNWQRSSGCFDSFKPRIKQKPKARRQYSKADIQKYQLVLNHSSNRQNKPMIQ